MTLPSDPIFDCSNPHAMSDDGSPKPPPCNEVTINIPRRLRYPRHIDHRAFGRAIKAEQRNIVACALLAAQVPLSHAPRTKQYSAFLRALEKPRVTARYVDLLPFLPAPEAARLAQLPEPTGNLAIAAAFSADNEAGA